jgi:hypothetical protein
MIKTTWRKVVRFSQAANAYVGSEPKDTKLKYALQRILAQMQEKQAAMDLQFNKVAVDNALEYTEGVNKGAIMRDPQDKLMFSRDGTTKVEVERAKILDTDDVEIEPYLATRIPSNLDFAFLEIFRGFVISDEVADKAVEERLAKAEAEEEKEEQERLGQKKSAAPNGKDETATV